MALIDADTEKEVAAVLVNEPINIHPVEPADVLQDSITEDVVT